VEDTRFPWTYSADHIRGMVGHNYTDEGKLLGTKLSRADAARIKCEIARIIGMDERKLAELIANDFLAKVRGEK
jgi:hypothetical protein